MKMKKRIAMILALVMAAGTITACGGSADSTTATTTSATTTSLKEEYAEVVDEIEVETKELENKTVKFLSSWDINPADGKAVPVELELFQTRYGGEIEWVQVSWDGRYDKLTTLVAADDSPDMFSAGDLDTFPKGAITGMFSPLDDYVDFSDEIWSGISTVNDQFVYNGKHYVAATSTDAGVVMIYNKRVLEENNLTDPWEYIEAGTWNWNTLMEMMLSFCDKDEGKYAIDGWWFESAISLTTGVPYIGMEDGKVVHNLDNPLIAKAQEYMYNMNKNELPYPKWEHAWSVCPSNIADGKTLFYPCGIWTLYEADTTEYGAQGEIGFAPMPRCEDADEYYIPTSVTAFSLISGAKNPEGVAAYLQCARIAQSDDRVAEIAKQQYMEDYSWTEEMYESLVKTKEMTNEHPMIEFYSAVSPDLYDIMNNPIKDSFNNGASWAQTKESIKGSVEAELDKANARLAN